MLREKQANLCGFGKRIPMGQLTHIDEQGHARMVDTSEKPVTSRRAVASARVSMSPATVAAIQNHSTPKGDPLETARLAGIVAAKRTAELIPLCHPLRIESVGVDFDLPDLEGENGRVRLRIRATASISGKTGVEMEALTAVAVAALTIYDMCKAIDKTMSIGGIRLIEKTGGRSGAFRTK